MDRRQFLFILSGVAALFGAARSGHAECGEQSASEFVGDLYREQARLLAAKATLSKDEFYDLFARRLRKWMRAHRLSRSNRPIGPLLNVFFGWGVSPGMEVTIEKIALVSGNTNGPATVGVDLSIREERQKILVHVVRQREVLRVANIIYDSGKSLFSHYRGIARESFGGRKKPTKKRSTRRAAQLQMSPAALQRFLLR
jgi:hypothetical protein